MRNCAVNVQNCEINNTLQYNFVQQLKFVGHFELEYLIAGRFSTNKKEQFKSWRGQKYCFAIDLQIFNILHLQILSVQISFEFRV